jgi:ABC-2 type transport system ATP-binding protein
MTDTIVEVSGLSKRFGGVSAIDGLSFTVQRGEIMGLVGPDGAGKTTTLRVLAGILGADAGAACVAGSDVVRNPEAAKRRVSYMPQQFGLYDDLTVDENIRFYAALFEVDARARRPRAGRLLTACGMSPFRRRLAGLLSGGMKRKLGLVCALIHTPELLLLDEPTTGVDPVSRREFWTILYSLVFEGVSVVISTAYLDEAERCHRLLLLHRGQRVFYGTPAALKRTVPGAVLAVSSSEPQKVEAVVVGAEGVLTAMAMGDAVHLVVDDPGRRIPEVRRRIEAAQLPFADITQLEASVEDAFVYTISQPDGGRGVS